MASDRNVLLRACSKFKVSNLHNDEYSVEWQDPGSSPSGGKKEWREEEQGQ